MQHECRCSRVRGVYASFTDVKINPQVGNMARRYEWRHAPEAWPGIGKKSDSRVLASKEEYWLSELAEALQGVLHVVWGRWKSQHRKIVYLPPYVEKSFNTKVIKSFVPELRSRKCFWVSGFLCYLYMSYEHSMYISHIHVWLCYKNIFIKTFNTLGTPPGLWVLEYTHCIFCNRVTLI